MISVISCTRLSLRVFERAEQLQIVDHQHVEAALALEAPRPRGELGDRKAAGLVDIERDRLHQPRRGDDAMKFGFGDVAAPDLVGWHRRPVRR